MADKVTKIVQSDARGQVVIPKGIRKSLKLDEGSAFWVYEVDGGIYLKKIDEAPSIDKVKKEVSRR